LQAVRDGAQDYLVKAKAEGKLLSRSIRYAIERKRVEEALRASEQRYRRLLGSTTDYIYTVTVENGHSFRSAHGPGCVAVTGYSPNEYEADSNLWFQMIHKEDRQAVTGQITGLLSGETVPPLEHRIRHKNGSVRWVRNTPVPRKDDQGKVISYDGLVSDITERKQVEEALAEERNILRTLIDTIPDAIYVKDAESRFVLGNPGVAQLMGVPNVEELKGKNDFDFYPRDLATQYYADEQAIITSGQSLINRVEPVIDSTGKNGWFLTTKAPIRDSRGKIVGLVGIGRDITEHKRAEEQHRLSEARLQAILDNTTAVIYLKDTQGRYLLVNRRFEALFHVTREQVMNKTDHDIFPKEMADTFRANDLKVQAAAAPIEFEEIAPHDGNLQTYISIKFPLSDTAGVPYAVCGISTDITERKRGEEQLRHAYAERARSEEALRRALAELKRSHEELKAAQLQLIQAEKLESIGTLAAGVAHEVKNPLQTILMGVDYLTHQKPIDNPCANMVLVEMRDAIGRADSIVRELLEYAAANHPEVADEELSAIIEQSLGLMKFELIKHRISVVRELSPGLPLLKLDRNKIQQVFINLFLNSIQAMPEGGSLTVRTYSKQSANAQSVTTDSGPAPSRCGPGSVIAEIEDTGVGIRPEILTKVFDPFFTTKPPGVGNGLGLSVTKKIIELHGATMNIANCGKRGVRVSIQFKI
ncbi:MAG: PAS domain S-box protein, partial [Verrucomicrobiota bacterium]